MEHQPRSSNTSVHPPSPVHDLETRFFACWPDADSASRVFADLLRLYSAPARAYHDALHLRECLAWVDAYAQAHEVRHLRAVELSIFFHDAVMSSGRSDDEQQSHALLRSFLADRPEHADLIAQIGRGISATRNDAVPSDALEALVRDADRAILGADRARYHAYASTIRREYALFPDEVYRIGRRRFIEETLDARRLYTLDFFAIRLEGQARVNLSRELAHLSADLGGAP